MSRATRRSLFGVLDSPQAANLHPADKLVLVYLVWRKGNNSTCWPSLRTIETDLHIDRRTCLRSIARLCAAGCVEKTSGHCGRGHSNHYAVLLDKRRHAATFSKDIKGGVLSPEKVASTPLKEPLKEPSKNTSPNSTTKPKHRKAARVVEYTLDFLRFWTIYPRKTDKFEAFEVWTTLAPGPELVEKIIAGVRAYSQTEQWTRSLADDGGKYIPHPATFLNKRRWEDTPPAKPEPQPGDPDWLPTEEELEARRAAFREKGATRVR